MKELIEWFLQMEHLAGSLYLRLSHKFNDDPAFSRFLLFLSKEEDQHLELIRESEHELLKLKESPPSDIIFDRETRERLEAPARELYGLLASSGKISKKTALKLIVKIEFSEWNSLFLYAAHSIRKEGFNSQKILDDIQAHRNRIEKFVSAHPGTEELTRLIHKLPRIGKKRMLIVEDKTPLRLFLGQMLENSGVIETALNGEDAFKKIRSQLYDIIVSNIDIPRINGVELLNKAVEKGHAAGEKFLIYSRIITPEIEKLLKDHKPQFLKLPFGTNLLQKKIDTMLVSKES